MVGSPWFIGLFNVGLITGIKASHRRQRASSPPFGNSVYELFLVEKIVYTEGAADIVRASRRIKNFLSHFKPFSAAVW